MRSSLAFDGSLTTGVGAALGKRVVFVAFGGLEDLGACLGELGRGATFAVGTLGSGRDAVLGAATFDGTFCLGGDDGRVREGELDLGAGGGSIEPVFGGELARAGEDGLTMGATFDGELALRGARNGLEGRALLTAFLVGAFLALVFFPLDFLALP